MWLYRGRNQNKDVLQCKVWNIFAQPTSSEMGREEHCPCFCSITLGKIESAQIVLGCEDSIGKLLGSTVHKIPTNYFQI